MPCPFQWLVITDGTTNDAGNRNQVDLLSPAGFCVLEDGDWRPAITVPKGGGMWKDSQLADGRRPADFKAQNVIETMTLTVTALDQDQLIRDTQELRRLLTKSRTYGTTSWQTEPVWIEAQSPGESEMRYAIIWDWGTPNDGNPYEEPFFQTVARAGMNDFILTLEREPYWRHVYPGSSECVEIAGYGQDFADPWYVEYNATTTIITVPANAVITDLHDAAMTVEAWVTAGGWGETTGGFLVNKGWPAPVGWYFYMSNVDGLVAFIDCAGMSGVTSCGTDVFYPDVDPPLDWHHLAFTWDDATYLFPRIWIDGVEQSNVTQNRVGVISSDVGLPLNIGNDNASNHTWDGDIGWVRVSNAVLYTGTFTPPPRCTLPAIVGTTVGQWIGPEGSGTAIDNQQGLAAIDGTLANGTFYSECYYNYGNVDDDGVVVPTCEDEVYTANKDNMANITHIFVETAGVGFGSNLIDTGTPYLLLPNVPANGDAVYFGSEAGRGTPRPFASLVFNISIAATYGGIAELDLEYSQGGAAWAALTPVQDDTYLAGHLGLTGSGSMHWVQPNDWLEDTVNGVTASWVRMVCDIPVPPGDWITPPTQGAGGDIYTITWPYIELLASEAEGDVPALIQMKIRNRSDNLGVGIAPELYANRIICGLRSYDRGANFTPYINIADEQNHVSVVVTPGTNTAFSDDSTTSTGRVTIYNPVGVEAMANRVLIRILRPLSTEYTGKYHMYLRARQSGGAAGDIQVRILAGLGTAQVLQTSETLAFANVNAWQLLDFGTIYLPGIRLAPNELFHEVRFWIDASAANGTPNLYLYDLILMPVDEWVGDFIDPSNNSTSPIWENTILLVDSMDPRYTIRSLNFFVRTTTGEEFIRSTYLPIVAGPAIVQSNSRQRLWFLTLRTAAAASSDWRCEPYVCSTVQVFKNQRYYSMRGDR